MSPMLSTDYAKELAAKKSLDFIEDGAVVGLGTGSTATRFIKLLGERVKRGLKTRADISSSDVSRDGSSSQFLRNANVTLETLLFSLTINGFQIRSVWHKACRAS